MKERRGESARKGIREHIFVPDKTCRQTSPVCVCVCVFRGAVKLSEIVSGENVAIERVG